MLTLKPIYNKSTKNINTPGIYIYEPNEKRLAKKDWY